MSEAWYTCRPGFRHRVGDVCTHPAIQDLPPPSAPARRVPFRIPADHDTVVVNGQGQITRSYKQGGFYSEEATALRREANKLKYAPKWQQEQAERERVVAAKIAAKSEFMAG